MRSLYLLATTRSLLHCNLGFIGQAKRASINKPMMHFTFRGHSKWHRPPGNVEEAVKRSPFMATQFKPTRFDGFISSVGSIDPNSPSLRLYNLHCENREKLHISYLLMCWTLSGLIFTPMLYALFGNHGCADVLFNVFSEYVIDTNTCISDIAHRFQSFFVALREYQVWRIFECGAGFFLWACLTDRIRYTIFVNVVGKIWSTRNWTNTSKKTSMVCKLIEFSNALRGKRGNQSTGLL